MSADFTILGGGVAGLCMAVELQSRGAAVSLIDPAGPPGPHGCSWWAGGMLAPDCEGVVAEPPVVREGRKAADWWAGKGATVTRAGTLVLALGRDRSELDRFARRTENSCWLDANGIAGLEPDLAGRFDRALFMADEAHLNPRAALDAMCETLKYEKQAKGTMIDCRGLAARDVLPDLRGVKGEMVVLRCPDLSLSRPVRLLHPRFPLYIVPRGDGVFMLGATQIESAERRRATVRSVMELLNAAYALHPAFGEAELIEIGCDARPAFPDNLPRLRHLPDRLCANGLFRHGFLLAPALARMAADLLLEGQIPEEFYEDHR